MGFKQKIVKWAFPSEIAQLEAKVEALQIENYQLKRKVNDLQRKASLNPLLFPYWSADDWESAYGKDE